MIPNVLAQRYASKALREIWSPEGRILLERQLWIAVMKAQAELGLDIPADAIAAYEGVVDQVDLADIDARERVTRHDVKARIEAFNDLAGHQHIHKGMTSRDLTENVEQLQVYRSLQIVRDKTIAVLGKLATQVEANAEVVIAARTHNVAAQPTTVGKRIAMFGEELYFALGALELLLVRYPVRGIKGAVGTQMDQLSLFGGDTANVAQLESSLAAHLGLPAKWTNVGQVYPRSLDHHTISLLVNLAAAPSSFCRTLRLMAGHDTASEGFAKGQTGSSAMPHKMNARSCERVNGFHAILKGHQTMIAALAGDQWNEGDVSCSVVRRVALPDAFFAMDGLYETFMTILNQMGVAEAVVAREFEHYLPFLMTTTVMMDAVKAGIGRETAHKVIKEHAVAAVNDLRSGAATENDLIARLAADERLGLSADRLDELMAAGRSDAGAAREQAAEFVARVRLLAAKNPEAAAIEPGSIL